MKFIMYNKNGCGQGCLSIGAWHVGVAIMVPETISKKLRPKNYTHRYSYEQCLLHVSTCKAPIL